ncbi:MAG: hypothetical protein AAGI28_03580 [Pseudomonadota bacterium]
MLKLTRDTVTEWLENDQVFAYEFMRYSYTWHRAVGLDIEISDELVREAHHEWVTIYNDWRKNKFQRGAVSLSYTKTFAILLHCLSKRLFCGTMREFVPTNKTAPEFNGSEELKAEIRADLLGAPEIVTALEFCICVLNFYEARRLDRAARFVFRMTETGRHDLIAALHSREMSAEALFIAFENLYSRH